MTSRRVNPHITYVRFYEDKLAVALDAVRVAGVSTLLWASIRHEYDFPQGIGAIPS